MKISRSPSSPQPGSKAKLPGVGEGKEFAVRLSSTEAAARSQVPRNPAVAKTTAISDIGADLKAGKITPGVAIDRVVERILDRQLGKNAGAAVREKIAAALRESLTDDPMLAAKVRALSTPSP
jgi:hypothetical protein